jgi:hypothetical protein
MMRTNSNEMLIRALFASARTLEPTDAEVARAVARAAETRRGRISLPATSGWRRLALPALVALALAGSGYATVPPLRAAIEDSASTFADYVAGDDSSAPGRPLRPGESAAHGFQPGSEPRVIAEADGYKLQFISLANGTIEFDLGETGVGLAFAIDELSGHAVYVLGPGAMQNADEHGHVPLFGVTAPQIDAVELTYSSGPPLRVGGIDGGFVLLADPTRDPQEVVAYVAGEEVERASLHNDGDGIDIDWGSYGPPSPRVPIECQPGLAGNTPPAHCPSDQ